MSFAARRPAMNSAQLHLLDRGGENGDDVERLLACAERMSSPVDHARQAQIDRIISPSRIARMAQMLAQLRALVADADQMPRNRVFKQAGVKRLWDQMVANGGVELWSALLDVQPPPPRGHAAAERHKQRQQRAEHHQAQRIARIDATLTMLIARHGRERFPTQRQFREAGVSADLELLRRNEGVAFWAERHGLPAPVHTKRGGVEGYERALREIVDELGRFPTVGELHQHGHASLYQLLKRTGGLDAWARKLGVDPPQLVRPRSDAELDRELRGLVAELGRFPEPAELGPDQRWMWQRMRAGEGAHVWAERLGVPAPRAAGQRRQRTDDEALQALQEIVGELGRFPRPSELKGPGRFWISEHVRRRGGVQRWAARLGVPAPSQRRMRPESEVEQTLRELVARYGHFPTFTQMRAAGHDWLYHRIRASGGPERWAQRVGVAPPAPVRRTDADVEQAARELVAQLGYLPRASQLRQRGLGWMAVRLGGREGLNAWARQLGVECR